MANACFVPSFNPWAGNFTVSGNGGGCPNGSVTTTVSTGDGQDHVWSYLAVPTIAAQSAAALRAPGAGARQRAAGRFPRRR